MFRFTIRDVLWLTAFVALGIALWLERQRSSRDLLREQQKSAFLTSRGEAALAALKGRGIPATWYDTGVVVTVLDENGGGGGYMRIYPGK